MLQRLASRIDPDATASELSVAEQQIVEIAKALSVDARILVMDEPTAALDEVDAQRLLSLVRKLRQEGVAIIYISHRISEIAGIADRITVMNDGRKIETGVPAELTTGRIVLDPQGSAEVWHERRGVDRHPGALRYLPENLSKVLEGAQYLRHTLIIIDTAPHVEKGMIEAIRLANLIICPIQLVCSICPPWPKPPGF